MKRPQEFVKQLDQLQTIVMLTGVFEGLASMRIAQIKNQVQQSQEFFDELWVIYKKLHVNYFFDLSNLDTTTSEEKDLFIVVSAEAGFGGDIDSRLVEQVSKSFDPMKHDIIVIGRHGAQLLAQRAIPIKKYYKLPTKDTNINVSPLINSLTGYNNVSVFYQSYISLMVQDAKRIELKNAVKNLSVAAEETKDVISESTFIFEPDTFAVAEHLEGSMMGIALSQLILESKLAQYASRFKAMSAASKRSQETLDETRTGYNRAKRAMKDTRLKEMISGLKGLKKAGRT
jgi:ATP synthase F1 gamma subunit